MSQGRAVRAIGFGSTGWNPAILFFKMAIFFPESDQHVSICHSRGGGAGVWGMWSLSLSRVLSVTVDPIEG